MNNVLRKIVIAFCVSMGLDSFGGSLDDRLSELGYVDVAAIDSDIVVELMYATDNNFVGKVMYENLNKAYLHADAAKALGMAQKELKRLHPRYNLKVCDASRPMSVQRIMYNAVKGTSKAKYVSNPANGGGLHNYGLAVDITIVDENGYELDMGTKVDHLGFEANIDKEQNLVVKGILTRANVANRNLLRRVMKAGGWMPLKSEWWHFNFKTRSQAKTYYKRLDF
jgi:D-ala-D-ala dipeptidase